MALALLAVLVGLLLQNLWVQDDARYVGLHRCVSAWLANYYALLTELKQYEKSHWDGRYIGLHRCVTAWLANYYALLAELKQYEKSHWDGRYTGLHRCVSAWFAN
jgi:hypothetical protein